MSADWELMTNAEGTRAYRAQWLAKLRDMLTPGQTIYCMLRHVSTSGMSRRISLFIVNNGELDSLDYAASRALDWKISDKGGIVVSGCGMDMGFHLVYSLGASVWPTGTPTPHGTRNGTPDSAGGYALKHSWI